MIKANELRIGNVVLRKSDMFQTEVHSVYTSHVKIWCNPLAMFHESEIEPIPLTEEILLKCGFVKSSAYFDYKINGFEVGYITDDEFFQFEWSFKVIDLKHLHQLQNLYFALTGEELKYKQ